jgi:hypothetical protein
MHKPNQQHVRVPLLIGAKPRAAARNAPSTAPSVRTDE